MGIIQEDRLNAPKPEVSQTNYGAQYVKAATESQVNEPEVAGPAVEEAVEVPQEAAEVALNKKPAVKKAGRPKKTKK